MNIKLFALIENGTPAANITVLFFLSDGADLFRWHMALPIMERAAAQSCLEARMEELRCKIYHEQYRGALLDQGENETPLDAWRRWEADGCRNPDGTVIPKAPWSNTFPYDPETENSQAVKKIRIAKLLKKGLLAEALAMKGEL